MKRVFLIVLDSVGIGEEPDAAEYGDVGSNTIKACSRSPYFSMPNMRKLGFFNIDGMDIGEKEPHPTAAFARMQEQSKGKDTTIGHWEIAGHISPKPMPTYPNGFPRDVIDAFSKAVGRGVLCNKPYSGTEVIKDYGEEHMKTGKLIVYTSADSVFQIAAHEDVIPVQKLYEMCEKARKILTGKYGVGRVIARPFIGNAKDGFTRTKNRRDFSLEPTGPTILDLTKAKGMEVVAVGKIEDIFEHRGMTRTDHTTNNHDGIEKTIQFLKDDFEGLLFTNLVDTDMIYGHRNDVEGYAGALEYFDSRLPEILAQLKEEDVLFITADHGCDPTTPSTDHSREYVPILAYGKPIRAGVDLGVRKTFADLGQTISDYLGLDAHFEAESFWKEIAK